MEESIEFDMLLDGDFCSPRFTAPSCKDLGLDSVTDVQSGADHENRASSHHVTRYEYTPTDVQYNYPFSPQSETPLPDPYGGYYGLEPAFVRRRNERERERVRCVNDGYSRLREHLPLENKEKRISKVETLRCAINYIEHLQKLLGEEVQSQGTTDYESTGKAEKYTQNMTSCGIRPKQLRKNNKQKD